MYLPRSAPCAVGRGVHSSRRAAMHFCCRPRETPCREVFGGEVHAARACLGGGQVGIRSWPVGTVGRPLRVEGAGVVGGRRRNGGGRGTGPEPGGWRGNGAGTGGRRRNGAGAGGGGGNGG